MIACETAISAVTRASPPRERGLVLTRGSAAFWSVAMERPVMISLIIRNLGVHGQLLGEHKIYIMSNAVLEDLRKVIEFAPCLKDTIAYYTNIEPGCEPLDLEQEALTVLSDLHICTNSVIYTRLTESSYNARPIDVVLPGGSLFSSIPVDLHTPVGHVAALLTHLLYVPAAYSLAINCGTEGGIVQMSPDTFMSLPLHALAGQAVHLVECSMS